MIKFKQISDTVLYTNTYIIHNDKDALIVDANFNPNKIINYIKSKNLNVVGILLTHGHFDHIYSLEKLYKLYNIPVYCSKETDKMLKDSEYNLSNTVSNDQLPDISLLLPTIKVKENSIISMGDFQINVYLNPGHSLGCTSYLFEKNFIITGDFIFKSTIGRTDLLGSNPKSMYTSIEKFQKIFNNTNLILLPGHGEVSTTEVELKKLDRIKKRITR